jgi:hypothetical protein
MVVTAARAPKCLDADEFFDWGARWTAWKRREPVTRDGIRSSSRRAGLSRRVRCGTGPVRTRRQKDVRRARTSVPRLRRSEAENVARHGRRREPMSNFVAQDRVSERGVNPLAMDDEDRSRHRPAGVGAKGSYGCLRLFGGRTMKIEGIEHGQKTAGELAEPLTESDARTLCYFTLASHLEGGRDFTRSRDRGRRCRSSLDRRRHARSARRQRPSPARVVVRARGRLFLRDLGRLAHRGQLCRGAFFRSRRVFFFQRFASASTRSRKARSAVTTLWIPAS